MNLVIDFTQNSQYSITDLENMEDINQITFIVPIFLFLQNNFKLIYNYVQFLSQRPLIKTNIKPTADQDEIKKMEQHSVVVVRGTFDHMHLGHQVVLLTSIYSTSHKLIIQVKDDSILANKILSQLIQPIELRRENIRKFIQNIKPQIQVKIETINEVYGTVPYTKGIDAVVISEQSLHSSKHINKLRKSNGVKKVSMVISPLITNADNNSPSTKQQRVDGKISSRKIRQFLLVQNNFTLAEFLAYRQIWDNLIQEINSLCRIKDIDFMVSEKWWERVVYKHSKKDVALSKKIKRNNRQIFDQIVSHNNVSTPNQQSLRQIAVNLALLFEGIQEEEKNLQAVVKNFLQNLMKKKGKSKQCKKIRKMILNDIKQFNQKSNPSRKAQTLKMSQNLFNQTLQILTAQANSFSQNVSDFTNYANSQAQFENSSVDILLTEQEQQIQNQTGNVAQTNEKIDNKNDTVQL